MKERGSDGAGGFASEMATLSAIAYCRHPDQQLAIPDYATGGRWQINWGPVTSVEGNCAFILGNVADECFALVVRGTMSGLPLVALENWFNNLSVDRQEPCEEFGQHANISRGAASQARSLWRTRSEGKTLAEAVGALPNGGRLFIAGHSLGGNLAAVLAPHASVIRNGQLPDRDTETVIYTFAAPTAGNTDFANAFNSHFPNSWRYWNALDIIPDAWASMSHIASKYLPEFACPNITLLRVLEDRLSAAEAEQGSVYAQPNGTGNMLPGTLVPLLLEPPSSPWFRPWDIEAVLQHSCNTYLNVLGAPIVHCVDWVTCGRIESSATA